MGPLTGIRVLEIGVAVAAPMCARYLGHLGAEVIKVDNRAKGIASTGARWAPPGIGLAGLDLLPGTALNAEKQSIGLNMKAPGARDAFIALIRNADVFVNNMSVPALKSLRLTYRDLQPENPRLIYMSMPGFGSTPGPYRDYRSWGPNLSALSGVDYLTGDADRDPVLSPSPLPDFVGAYHGIVAVLAALLRRDVTGEGQEIELAQFETTIGLLGARVLEYQRTGTVPMRAGNAHPSVSMRDIFPSSGHDRWLAIEVESDEEWAHLASLDGMPAELRAPRFCTAEGRRENASELYQLLATWTGARTNVEAAALLQAAGVAGNPVQTGWDHLTDPHMLARGFWRVVQHDRMGLDVCSSLPVRLSATPARYDRAMPSFGHDTEEVLREVGGLADAEISTLLTNRAVEREAPIPAELADVPLERPSKRWAWPLLRLGEYEEPTPDDISRPTPGPATSLAGCRILDLSDELSAHGAYLLTLAGADVVRVEPPGGAAFRHRGPMLGDSGAYETYWDGGKRSIVLDLETEDGQAAFRLLAANADIVYESRPPGWMAERGLDWERLHALNPRLILVSATRFGQTGPYRDHKGGELGMWALSSMISYMGYPDRRPLIPGGDLGTSLMATQGAIAALAALRARNVTGAGQWVDVSAHETMAFTSSSMLGQIEDFAERHRSGDRAPGLGPYGFFRCADRLVNVMALFPEHWAALSGWIDEKTGRNVSPDERFNTSSSVRYALADEIAPHINALTGLYSAEAFCTEAQQRGIPAMPVNSLADLLANPHLEAIDFWRTVELADGTTVKWPGPPFRMAGLAEVRRAPRLGEHTDEVLREWSQR